MTARSARKWIGALLMCGALAAPTPAQQAEVDLALALAIDCSYSVDTAEYRLQMRGLGEALQNPKVIEAIQAGANRKIALAVYLWSDEKSQRLIQPWIIIDSPQKSQELGRSLEIAPRSVAQGGTGISAALVFGAALFNLAPNAERRVIDLSSDGRNNMGPPVATARNEVVSRGITINGLAIANEWPTLDQYLEAHVAGGQGNFVVKARNYEEYGAAILKKLVKEITGPGVT